MRLGGVLLFCAMAPKGDGFTYVATHAGRVPPETIVHPMGYTGRGGALRITLGLHSDFRHLEEKVSFSARHAAAIWTHLLVQKENFEPSVEIPRLNGADFFGTLAHEVGHALGLAHPTEPTQGGAPGKGKFATVRPGPNERLDLDAGDDGVRGSHDDRRADDINLVFFKRADNNPFTLPDSGVIDSTTYSRDIAHLPSGSIWVNVSSREVANEIFGLPSTEGLMVGGGSLIPGQVRRGLTADDVAGIRYAMSGLDEIAGTDDDYTVRIDYVGIDDDADILIRFDLEDGYAVTTIATVPISGRHAAMRRGRLIRYNPKLPGRRAWYFPQPEPVRATVDSINPQTVRLRMKTEPGRRYGATWPGSTRDPSDAAREVIVRHEGVNRSAMNERLFLFIAAGPDTELTLAFPSTAPDAIGFEAFELVADPLEP